MTESPRLEEVPCNLCGSTRSRTVYHKPYRGGSIVEGGALAATTDEYAGYGRVVRCLDCGLVYTNPRPRQEDLFAGYGSCVDETYLSEGSSRSINAHLSLSTIKRFVKSGRLLEVGCFAGHFLNAARVDFDVEGIEPSEWACRIATERFKLKVRRAAFDADHFEPASFDVAAMVDVIEHVTDPVGALARAARALKPGGLLYLVTPDVGSLSARLLRGYWWGLRPAHIYYFDRATMARALEKAGLRVVLSKSFGRIFTYGYWADRLRNYPRAVFGPVRWGVDLLGLENKLVYVDTRDSMEICAVKR
jgi:SAM-dependent methyltransferase